MKSTLNSLEKSYNYMICWSVWFRCLWCQKCRIFCIFPLLYFVSITLLVSISAFQEINSAISINGCSHRAPLQPLCNMLPWCTGGFKGGPIEAPYCRYLHWGFYERLPIGPLWCREAPALSYVCTPDRCIISSRHLLSERLRLSA